MKKIISLLSICAGICTEIYAQSPYIHKVYDFLPAPGQFTNVLPEYENGNTKEDMIQKVEESIVGDEKRLISLGGYGGYVVFGFDHMVENKPGKYDFKIWGNAFYSNANPNPNAPAESGSCEPGIVMVSYDANGNGIPDDPWYELAGSEYHKPQTIKKYQLTYYKPDPNKILTPDKSNPFLTDTTYIRWENNQGDYGYVARNTYHRQAYYPQWISEENLVFEGTKLADNYVDESGIGAYYVQYAYGWGYADNHPNNNDRSGYDISWAVDEDGGLVELPGIHFVKVYTGVSQYCGWLGETSTEIMGAEDLHLQGVDISVPAYTEGISLNRSFLHLRKGENAQLTARVFSSNPSLEMVTWKSGNEDLVTINNNGYITTLTEGESYIVGITSNGEYYDTCFITITAEEIISIESITLNQQNISLEKGETYALSATILPENGTNKNIIWTSSNITLASVDTNGLVTALAKGTINMIVASENGMHSDTCVVTITDNSAGINTTNAFPEPKVYSYNKELHFLNLNAYSCLIISMRGQIERNFHIYSTTETYNLNLPSGIYILRAQKQNTLKIFKFIIL